MNHRNFQEAFDLIKEFYDHAWSTLLAMTGIMFGVVGVLFPMLINHIQSRENKSRLKNLEKEYEKQKSSMDSMAIETKIALGGIYLHQGNLQAMEYEIHGGVCGSEPLGIYLSYLKSLNYFLDTSIMKHIDTAYDQLIQVSDTYCLTDTYFNEYYYPELRFIHNQVIEKLEKAKKNKLYSEIISYLNDLFRIMENKYNKNDNKESPPQGSKYL
jgi:hypothetical protein